jgi:hypothetical protein
VYRQQYLNNIQIDSNYNWYRNDLQKTPIDIVNRISSHINRIIYLNFNKKSRYILKNILITSGSSRDQDLSNQAKKVA